MRVLRAAYFHRALDPDDPVKIDLIDMDTPVAEYIDNQLATFDDHDALEAEIERLSFE